MGMDVSGVTTLTPNMTPISVSPSLALEPVAMTFASNGNAICQRPSRPPPMNAPASCVLLPPLKTRPIWFSTAPFTTICALSTQISSPLICPRPSHAFCPKTRIELLHLSMTAMFYAAAMRVLSLAGSESAL